MSSYAYAPADDPLFGTITVQLDHEGGRLVVDGDGIPRADLRRAAATPVDAQVPIGTRDPDALTLAVGGTPVVLRPAKGFLTRRSYRVDAGEGGAGYAHRLVPVSLGTSRLLRDGVPLGEFTSTGDGQVTVEWSEDGTGARPEAYDAAMGYALAAAFGTGAEPWWELALNAALDLWP
ncbi:hypothetical protein ACFVGY_03710 [Streptomyces sp. NPDC127106]|uniref:hypothetical protein n=1 Tax=Streptomyces sp. NPDC127106 TaxID=3345360 RepID=UPI0036421ADD